MIRKIRIVELTHVRATDGASLFFTFDGDQPKRKGGVSYLHRENMIPFDGERGWFEIEKIYAKPWPFWKALRYLGPEKPPVEKEHLPPWLRDR
jgi:hypothetical protein